MISDRKKGSRVVEIVSSAITWNRLQHKVAEHLNIFPTSLDALYRLSTDNKKDLPCALTSQQHLDTLITLLRPLVVPPLLANGRHSTRRMKSVTVEVFNKDTETQPVPNDNNVCWSPVLCSPITDIISRKRASLPNALVLRDKPKSDAEIFHEKRVTARRAITEAFACPTHSLPDKPALCWKDPIQNMCYPITETNLNFWASLNVRPSSHTCLPY